MGCVIPDGTHVDPDNASTLVSMAPSVSTSDRSSIPEADVSAPKSVAVIVTTPVWLFTESTGAVGKVIPDGIQRDPDSANTSPDVSPARSVSVSAFRVVDEPDAVTPDGTHPDPL